MTMTEQVPDIEVKVVVNNWNGLREKGIEGYRGLLKKLRQPLEDIAVSYDIDMQSEEERDAIKIGKPILGIIDQRININSVHRY
jgi:hypothetical protein